MNYNLTPSNRNFLMEQITNVDDNTINEFLYACTYDVT